MKQYIFPLLFLFLLLVSCGQQTISETEDATPETAEAKTELMDLLAIKVENYDKIYEADWSTGGSHNKSYHIAVQDGNIIFYQEFSFDTPIPTYCEEIYSTATDAWTTCRCGAKYYITEEDGQSVSQYVNEGIVGDWEEIACSETPPEELDTVEKEKITAFIEKEGIQNLITFTNRYGTCYFLNSVYVFCFREDGLLVFRDFVGPHPYLLHLKDNFDGVRAWEWPEISALLE